MSRVRELHDEAMRLAQQAMVARHNGEQEYATGLAQQAYILEAEAAEIIEVSIEAEPTCSILFRSAASLAYQAKEYDISLRLIAKGLSGFPPSSIARELRSIYDQVSFEQYLAEHEMILENYELELSMKGSAIGHGIIPYNEFIKRFQQIPKLLERTTQRLLRKEYQRSGRVAREYQPFIPVVQAFNEGSFIVRFQLISQNDRQLSLLFDASDVIDEVLSGIELINSNDEEVLERNMSEAYYLNFLFLVQEIAPDGDRVSLVGLSSVNKIVTLTRVRSEISLTSSQQKDNDEVGQPIVVEGELDYAKSRGNDEIGLTPSEGEPYTITVREGMDDLVRIYWKQYVKITGMAKGRNILLRLHAIL